MCLPGGLRSSPSSTQRMVSRLAVAMLPQDGVNTDATHDLDILFAQHRHRPFRASDIRRDWNLPDWGSITQDMVDVAMGSTTCCAGMAWKGSWVWNPGQHDGSLLVWRPARNLTCIAGSGYENRALHTAQMLQEAMSDFEHTFPPVSIDLTDLGCNLTDFAYAIQSRRCTAHVVPDSIFLAWAHVGIHSFTSSAKALAFASLGPARRNVCAWFGNPAYHSSREVGIQIMRNQTDLFESRQIDCARSSRKCWSLHEQVSLHTTSPSQFSTVTVLHRPFTSRCRTSAASSTFVGLAGVPASRS